MGAIVDPGFDVATELIERASMRGSPVLVAIDGRSGTGKSTFAAALGSVHHAPVIEGDAFYAGGVGVRTDTAERRADACIDRPKLRAVLEQVKAGRTAAYRSFDWDIFDGSLRDLATTVKPGKIVIVEGVYSSHHDFVDLLDDKILLTAPDAVRHQRLIQREGSIGPWERQWHEAEDWYFSRLAADSHFDLIIE